MNDLPLHFKSTALKFILRFLAIVATCGLATTTKLVAAVGDSSIAAGAYEGLLDDKSGYAEFVLDRRDSFSGTIFINRVSHPIQGRLSDTGQFIGFSTAQFPVSLQLTTQSGSIPTITGSAGGISFTAYRAAYIQGALATETGKYTLLLKPPGGNSGIPLGTGYATMAIGKTGRVRLTGKLADGEPFSYSTMVVGGPTGNQCVLHAPLKRLPVAAKGVTGFLLGAFTFEDLAQSDLDGAVEWLNPAISINTALRIVGARYVATDGGSALPGFTNGILGLSDTGLLSLGLIKQITLTSANKLIVTNPGLDHLKIKISASSGLFTGSFLYPGERKRTAFGGVILQRDSEGAGFFVSPPAGTSANVGLMP